MYGDDAYLLWTSLHRVKGGRPFLRWRDRLHRLVHRRVPYPAGFLSFEAVFLLRLQERDRFHINSPVLREPLSGQRQRSWRRTTDDRRM